MSRVIIGLQLTSMMLSSKWSRLFATNTQRCPASPWVVSSVGVSCVAGVHELGATNATVCWR